MNDYLRVYTADSRTFDLPVAAWSDGRRFVADQPAHAEELNITEVCLFSEKIDRPVRFILESITLVEGEAGSWTVNLSENEFGSQQYDLEYYATEQFGESVDNPTVLHWNHEKEQMTGD